MSKSLLKILVSIIWSFSIGMPSLNAADILDSNCEALKYQSSWPNYNKWNKGKFNTKYLLNGTSISCRKSDVDSCVVVKDDNTVSLTWSDLSDKSGNITAFGKKYYEAEYGILKSFREKLDSGKIVVRSATDDRYTAKNPADVETRKILAKIQGHPTYTIFNWLVIFDAYEYIVKTVNEGMMDDLKNNRSFNAGFIKNPKDMDFTTRTTCAKALFNKYLSGKAITETDLDGCFAYQAYCTENFALAGLSRDIQKMNSLVSHCTTVLKNQDQYKNQPGQIDTCKKRLQENVDKTNASIDDLNAFINKLNVITSTKMPQTIEYFQKLRDKYQKIANDLSALLTETKKDLKAEYVSRQNYNKLLVIGEACQQVMQGSNQDNTYAQALQQYVSVYPVASSYNGVAIDSNKTATQVKEEFKSAIDTNGGSAWGEQSSNQLIATCNGVSDIAVQKIVEARDKYIKAMPTDDTEYDVVAKVWNKTINSINYICNEYSYVDAYNSENTLDAVMSDIQKEEQEKSKVIQDNTAIPSQDNAYYDEVCNMSENKISEDKLKTAEELFNGLFAPVIEYDKADGTKGYAANPIPRLVTSKTFNQSTGLDAISETSFRNACIASYKRSLKGKKDGVITKAASGMVLKMSDQEIISNMNVAIAEIKKSKAKICTKAKEETTYTPIGVDGGIISRPNNDARVELLAKYIRITPGLFQEYISQNPTPVACSILAASYNNEEFQKVIKPVLGVANAVLFVASIVPSPIMIPCRVGLIAVSVLDGVVSINNIEDQLETIKFADNAVNAGFINYQNGEILTAQADTSIFWSYVSLGADATMIYSGVKGLSIASSLKAATETTKVVSTTADVIPSVYPLKTAGQTAGLVGEVYTPVFRLPLGFKNAIAKFYGYVAVYSSLAFGNLVTVPTRLFAQTEMVVKVAAESGETLAQNSTYAAKIFTSGIKTTVTDSSAFLNKLGMNEINSLSYTNLLTKASQLSSVPSSIINGQFISQIAPVVIGSGVSGAIGYKIITAIDGYNYVNYFLTKADGTTIRYSEIQDGKSIPNTEGAPVDPPMQKEIDDAIADYNKYCAGLV